MNWLKDQVHPGKDVLTEAQWADLMDGYNMKFETGKGLERMKNYDWKDPEEKSLGDYGKKGKKTIRNLQLY